METTVGERIEEIIFRHKTNATELAQRVGMTRQTVSQIQRGEMKLTYNFVYGIAVNYPDVDIRWLILGERTEGLLRVEEMPLEYYTPLKQKDQQITDLIKITKEQQAMIKELLTKIPAAK
jgi:transcriptional regulator with XRE-family HTH domain